MTDVRGKALPHTKAFMYNDMDATDGIILRGELLTILRLMLGQLRKVRLLQHRKAPVMLDLSFPLPTTIAYQVFCRSFWSRLWANVPAHLSPISTAKPSSYVLRNSTISPKKSRSGLRIVQSGISARRQGIRSRSGLRCSIFIFFFDQRKRWIICRHTKFNFGFVLWRYGFPMLHVYILSSCPGLHTLSSVVDYVLCYITKELCSRTMC